MDVGVGVNIEKGWMLERVGMKIGLERVGVDQLGDKMVCNTKAGQLRVLDGDGAVILRLTRRSGAAEVNTLLFSSPALQR